MSKSRDFLGPYRLARLIRVGSTAEVWEAIDETSSDNKRYALKVLRASCAEDKNELALLKHEFNVGKSLSSPRIIKVLDHQTDKGRPFLVLELFSELNMKQALRKGPDSLAFMLDKIIEQAAEGLYYMHTKNWIHRDIKPDNYLVARDGETKLIDFTIAEPKRTGLKKLFYKAKTVQGTRSYMSPEQIRGKLCDERSDIYSFGCVLFELVTGKPPFTGQTPNDLLSKHLSASIPSPIVYNENVTTDFAGIVKRMMAKKPDDRPESVWEFLKEFRTIEIWRKRPRVPEESVFDDIGGMMSAEDMIKRPDGNYEKRDKSNGNNEEG
ncbi:serine/threonine-protein kinase [Aporhodopirellula aestuarii]|uniref:Serine/threonine protein kinase n=1 Tax=Aporhodopirellula aestuarii TaxID=2950107 RepID=A0ABT0U449_9BACT|nr:serine/threonine-protein kinase [Aporhodopirellula aestuarii]MCM2371213.1 serine/threonine protein kinase [Aporhodopirellula aestuarii]